MFQAIVDGARKLSRAVTGGGEEPDPQVHALGEEIARAFIAGRFADVHALGTSGFRARNEVERFEARWRDAVADRLPLTGYSVADAGPIDVQFIPGLEDVDQEHFIAFLHLTFSSPEIPLTDERAFVIGAVVLDDGGAPRLGALHAH